MTPAVLAEQQRAKSEIEAALTIAAARPRDEKVALDNILVSCQRVGLAEKAQYQYARGGTTITGPSIVLMQEMAQRWGNLEYGFRELARYPSRGGEPGESVVEAFAWDMQTNTRRKVQFTVKHAMAAKGRVKLLSDPRDIYEYVANQSQRRVRTCIENVIPRDIIEEACAECSKTLKASIADIADATAKVVKAFADIGVTREMLEARIQRRIDAITAAQIIGLRKIYTSIRDGISEPSEWFTIDATPDEPKTTANAAKDALKRRTAKPQGPADPAPAPEQPPESTGGNVYEQAMESLVKAPSREDCNTILDSAAKAGLSDDYARLLREAVEERKAELRNS